MARKTATIVIEEDNRDAGSRFVITEMPATEGAKFAFQVFQLIASSGMDIDINSMDRISIIKMVLGAITSLHPDQFDEYRVQLMQYVQWQNPTDHKVVRKVMDSDIEEKSTIYKIMFESLKVNLYDFFIEIVQKFLNMKK